MAVKVPTAGPVLLSIEQHKSIGHPGCTIGASAARTATQRGAEDIHAIDVLPR